MTQTQVTAPWNGWEVVKPLGGGSFGSVYEIQRQLITGTVEKAAMKVISVPKESGEAQELIRNGYQIASINQRFLEDMQDIAREYALMAQLKGNANVVYCDDLHTQPKSEGIGWEMYIKMELLTPLDAVLVSPCSDAQAIKVGMDLCNALAACRKKNIIHRDIKPANILVSEDGTFKLGDFGVAKTTERTAGGTKTGTYNFMAPEVYNNQPYGTSVDIYSLGMVLYWMLNNRCGPFLPLPPTVPKASQLDEAKQRRFRGEPLPAPACGSPALQQIVLKACAFHPAQRFGTPEEMYAALAALGTTQQAPQIGTFVPTAHTDTADRTQQEPSTYSYDQENSIGNSWDDGTDRSVGVQPKWDGSGGTVGGDERPKKASGGIGPFDVKTSVTLTAQDAASGLVKKVTIRNHKAVTVTFPAGVTHGQVILVPGEGKEDPATGAKGDVHVHVKIQKEQPQDFWGGETPKKPDVPEYGYAIDPFTASKGITVNVKLGNVTRTLVIPAGVKDGQVVNGVAIYIHQYDMKQSNFDALPTAVLTMYRDRSAHGFLWTLGIFFAWLFFGIFTMLIPVMAAGMVVSYIWLIRRVIKINENRNCAIAVLKKRGA